MKVLNNSEERGYVIMSAGRLPILTEPMESEITRILNENPKLSVRRIREYLRQYLIEKLKTDYPRLSDTEVIVAVDNGEEELYGYKLPSASSIDYYIRDNGMREEILRRKKKPDKLDTPWTSAALNEEPISPDVIPQLTWMQVCRKVAYSKPLTIREARWFYRLSGFRERFSDLFLLKIGIPPEQNKLFIYHLIATWAELYAYREKIDTIAGIKEPDYSDLDSLCPTGNLPDLLAIFDYNETWAWGASSIAKAGKRYSSVSLDTIESVFHFSRLKEVLMTKIPKEGFVMLEPDKNAMPSTINMIRFLEIGILNHSLGDPDMSDSPILLYIKGLTTVLGDAAFNQRLMKLPYLLRINFLVLLREIAKEHPDVTEDMIKTKIKEMLDKFEWVKEHPDAAEAILNQK